MPPTRGTCPVDKDRCSPAVLEHLRAGTSSPGHHDDRKYGWRSWREVRLCLPSKPMVVSRVTWSGGYAALTAETSATLCECRSTRLGRDRRRGSGGTRTYENELIRTPGVMQDITNSLCQWFERKRRPHFRRWWCGRARIRWRRHRAGTFCGWNEKKKE